jgi:periplasmic divalent cation tolerance protein
MRPVGLITPDASSGRVEKGDRDMADEASHALFVYTTVANEVDAQRIAEHVVESRVAACVSIGAPVTSVFRWEPDAEAPERAAVQTEREIPLVIKTTTDVYAALETCIQEVHPYELPEIVAVPIERGLPAFLAWIEGATVPSR